MMGRISGTTRRPRLSFWSRQSLAVKLPVGLALLLSAVLGSMTVAVYIEMRSAVLGVASDRLDHAARQMADLLSASARQRQTALQTLVKHEALAAYLREANASTQEAAQQAVVRYLGNIQNAGVEVWNSTGRRVLSTGVAFPETSIEQTREIIDAIGLRTDPIVSRYIRIGDTLAYSVAAVLRDGEAVRGYGLERRRLANSAQTISLLTGLIGTGATMLLGNAVGSEWTDFASVIERPALDEDHLGELSAYQRAGQQPMLARSEAIAGTPWLVVVEFQRDLVMAPAASLLRRLVTLSTLLVIAASLLGWLLSRRLTTPLRLVTQAAEAIAQDRPAPRLALARGDELGSLAASFNTMADRVEDSRRRFEALVQTLEHRVSERTAALSAANKELEAFSYSVSHDLRAPLRAISGFAQILGEDHSAQLSEDARRCLEVIDRNVERMGQLIDDLLTFSRLGRQPIERYAIDMTAMAQSVADDIARAEGRPISFVIHPLPPARGERSLVRQVFVNFLQNAAKFTRPREDPRIEVGSFEQDGEVVYFIRDNGVGFDMKYADKLFGVFQRLHRAEEFEGTGVGLAIVQRIIHRHGGRVWGESTVGSGATFYFTLPFGEDGLPADEQRPGLATEASALSVDGH